MPPKTIRIRPYKDFLTPALHRRFATATAILAILCYWEAVIIGEITYDSLTWYFLGNAGVWAGVAAVIFNFRIPLWESLAPVSSLYKAFTMIAVAVGVLYYYLCTWPSLREAGFWSSIISIMAFTFRISVRTGLIFIPAFMTFILRVAQLHVGLRTSYSPIQTFLQYAWRFQTIQTLGWYSLSAYLFSEIYIWSIPASANLNRITNVPKTGRPNLNEKPIYLTSYLLFLALVQTGFHLFFDYDRIDMPVLKIKPEASPDQEAYSTGAPAVQLRMKLYTLPRNAVIRASVAAVVWPFIYLISIPVIPFVYWFNIRNFAWSTWRSCAKILWNLPKSGAPPQVLPFHAPVWLRTVWTGFLLTMLWEVANAALSAYVAQEPLKNERPITYESHDPNGSLLTGLRGKKLQTRAFAFWELVYIAQRFEGRRKIIFEDINRAGGSTWSQILAICLEVINGVNTRIEDYQRPPIAPVPLPAQQDTTPPHARKVPPLREIGATGYAIPPPPRSRSEKLVRTAEHVVKTHGQTPPGESKTVKILEIIAARIFGPRSPGGLREQFFLWIIQFLRAPYIGVLFRQEYRRKVATVVLGSPYGDVGIIVDAVDALTRLAVRSLEEDKYGNVQRDVKNIIQTFTTTVNKLERFEENLPTHWTDVYEERRSPEADIIQAALKGGLNQLIDAFGDYSEDLRLSRTEMRMAREAAESLPDQNYKAGKAMRDARHAMREIQKSK
ncbi:hypothetical protein B7494_g8076 [Chlorociboria aeruginascens]|nr:hypothetical protein B7494_g8076 [Chlorociboria aeruginascens]